MIKSFKVRLEPNNNQKSFLFANTNVSRFAYNWTLEQQQINYKNGGKFISNFDLRKKLTTLKQEELSWLYNYNVDITKQAVKDGVIRVLKKIFFIALCFILCYTDL